LDSHHPPRRGADLQRLQPVAVQAAATRHVTVARSSASNRYNDAEDSMLIKRPSDIRSSEITDKQLYLDRRQFIRAAGGTAVAAATGIGLFSGAEGLLEAAQPAPHGRKLENIQKSPLSVDEKLNKWEEITTYNNFYEFGVDKDAPSYLAKNLKTEP